MAPSIRLWADCYILDFFFFLPNRPYGPFWTMGTNMIYDMIIYWLRRFAITTNFHSKCLLEATTGLWIRDQLIMVW